MRLATQGMRLTELQRRSEQCTPSRAALMTGRYPDPLRHLTHVAVQGGMADGLTPWEVTIAQLLS